MKGLHSNILRLHHILDAITEIQNYISEVTEEDFLNNSEKRFATIKQIEIIGEACNNITDDIKNAHPEVAWRQIIGFRNISIYEYHNVSFHIVWNVANIDIPTLKIQMEVILAEIEND